MINNLFKEIPENLKKELFEEILNGKDFTVERIISDGHFSPKDFWYDQEKNELVFLLQGKSKISFDIEKKKCWNQENNTYSSDKQRNSDFFIFCLYFKFSKKIIDVIDVSNWHFYILSKEIIDSEYGNQKRVVLNKLKELTDVIEYNKINEYFENAKNKRNPTTAST